jgi:hypothetical protein
MRRTDRQLWRSERVVERRLDFAFQSTRHRDIEPSFEPIATGQIGRDCVVKRDGSDGPPPSARARSPTVCSTRIGREQPCPPFPFLRATHPVPEVQSISARFASAGCHGRSGSCGSAKIKSILTGPSRISHPAPGIAQTMPLLGKRVKRCEQQVNVAGDVLKVVGLGVEVRTRQRRRPTRCPRTHRTLLVRALAGRMPSGSSALSRQHGARTSTVSACAVRRWPEGA